MKFNSITLEGFGSIQDRTVFGLQSTGITYITGENGSGKSTIFNGLAWCLYGRSLKGDTSKDIPTKDTYRKIDFKGTLVALELELDTTYTIVRTIDYKADYKGITPNSSILIYKGDELVTDGLHKKDQQEYIERLIGMDYKVFTNSVLFGQRNTRLMAANGSEQRTLFEDIFNTSWVSKAKAEAKKNRDLLNSKLQELDLNINFCTEKRDFYSSEIVRTKKHQQDFNQNKESKLVELKGKLTTVTTNIDIAKEDKINASHTLSTLGDFRNSLVAKVEALDRSEAKTLLGSISELTGSIRDLESEKSQLQSKLTSVKNQHRRYSDKHDELIGDLVNQEDRLNSDIKKHTDALSSIKDSCHVCGSSLPKNDIDKAKEKTIELIDNLKTQRKIVIGKTTAAFDDMDIHRANVIESKKELESAIDSRTKQILSETDRVIQLQAKLRELNDTELDKQLAVADRELSNQQIAIDGLDTQIKQQISYKQDIEAQIKDLEQSKFIGADLEQLESSLLEHTDKLLLYQNEYNTLQPQLQAYTYWYSVGFGSTGLSNYIFQTGLDTLNVYLDNYARLVDFNISINIDMTKASKPIVPTIIKDDGVEFNYKSLSGGQKQLVDLCLALAIHEMTSESLPILILDEVFENLSPYNISRVYEFLQLKLETCPTLFIISPQLNLDYPNMNIFNLSLENGCTKFN